MDWKIVVDDHLQALKVSFHGEWDLGDSAEALEAMWTKQAETGIHKVLWDTREISVIEISGDQMRTLAGRQITHRPNLPNARAALLVSGDLEFGMARMIEAIIHDAPVDLQIFRELSAATEWLTNDA